MEWSLKINSFSSTFTVILKKKKKMSEHVYMEEDNSVVNMEEGNSAVRLQEYNSAFRNRLKTFIITNISHIDTTDFFPDAFIHFRNQINTILETQNFIKVIANLHVEFTKTVTNEAGVRTDSIDKDLYTNPQTIDIETDLVTFYDEYIVSELNRKISEDSLAGSGFVLSKIFKLSIHISKYEPYAGASYIEVPKFLRDKKAIINVKNKDNECFKYAVLSALFPAEKNVDRVQKYKPFEHLVDFSMTFPVDVVKIKKFEQQNPLISINVYMYHDDTKSVRPIRLTKEVKEKHIHLLMLTEQTSNVNVVKSHYCWIKNLGALLGKQVSLHKTRKVFCDRCLNHFTDQTKLNDHLINCCKQNNCKIQVPRRSDNILNFKNYSKQLMVPFIVYADIESILKNIDKPFFQNGGIQAYQKHDACSIGYYFHSEHNVLKSYYRSKRSTDCIEWFAKELLYIAYRVEDVLRKIKPLKMTVDDEFSFIRADTCHICGKRFLEKERRVRDHSHITGKFRGAAHESCNLNFQEAHHIPIVFHNLSNYDAHFLVKILATHINGSMTIIPNNEERYISFSIKVPSNITKKYADFIQLRFMDSFRFMSSSLDYLASLLPSESKKILHEQNKNLTDDNLKLLERKGVFCYDYIDSWSKFDETSLPAQDKFYSKLTESHISDEDYS